MWMGPLFACIEKLTKKWTKSHADNKLSPTLNLRLFKTSMSANASGPYKEHTPTHSFHINHYGFVMWNNLSSMPHRLSELLRHHDKNEAASNTINNTSSKKESEKHDDTHTSEDHHESEHMEPTPLKRVDGVRYPPLIVRIFVLVLLFLIVSGGSISYNMVAALASKYDKII